MLKFYLVVAGAATAAIVLLGISMRGRNLPPETRALGLLVAGIIVGICVGCVYLVLSL